ncbi:MAG: peptide ABC transporter substrate-binding protein [Chloroflexi bacterium]|nr:peptide ABC transporter substrate-binding protein [Chloroflexota bacterium]
MTTRDRLIVAALASLFVGFAAAIGLPTLVPGGGAASSPAVSPSPSAAAVAYREGILGRPTSIDPLTATSQADRDIVALVFSGLVRLGPDGSVVPDLASGWTVGGAGSTYTFTIRSDAIWQDGAPVTAADVVYTIHTLQDPAYTGPAASSWREVTVAAIDATTVRFTLKTPVASFLQAARQPLLPEHLLGGVSAAGLATATFNDAPVGTGPYRLVSWDATAARLEPFAAAVGRLPAASASPASSAAPSASPERSASPVGASPSATASGTPSTSPATVASPTPMPPPGYIALPAIEFHFYAAAGSLMADYRAGRLDAASGLTPTDALALAATPGSRLVDYPRTTYTGVVLNVRPGHPLLAELPVRQALLEAIDRPAIIASVLAGTGRQADTPIPPSSWAYDPTAVTPVAYSATAAAKTLKAAGWTKTTKGWFAPRSKTAFSIELITPDQVSNPIVFATTNAVAADWRRFGLKVTVTALTPHDFVDSRLAPGKYDAAVVDVDVGLDPDLYPFLASTQTTTGGANVSGVQIPALDAKLIAARAYGPAAKRAAAFRSLQTYLGQTVLSLPLFFRDEPVVVSDRVWGPTPREIADPSGRFWDVLTWRLASGR